MNEALTLIATSVTWWNKVTKWITLVYGNPSALLSFTARIHRPLVDSLYKRPVMWIFGYFLTTSYAQLRITTRNSRAEEDFRYLDSWDMLRGKHFQFCKYICTYLPIWVHGWTTYVQRKTTWSQCCPLGNDNFEVVVIASVGMNSC